jgi:energy-coupling factor transport system substrate-specific component
MTPDRVLTLTHDRPAASATPADLGVGARFSLHPHRDDFVAVLTDVLSRAPRTHVEVVTDDVSTFVRGTEADVLTYLHAALLAAANAGGHVVAHVQLSRGCPGEVDCALPDDALLTRVEPPTLPVSGVRAAAHWALYPLDDGGPGRSGDHMAAITAAIESARARVAVSSEHFVTRLDGDLTDVLTTVAAGWLGAAASVRHVVTHATLVVGSPSWSSAGSSDHGGTTSEVAR